MKTYLALLVLLVALPAHAFVLGGGDPDKDCRLAFDGVNATTGASGVVCVDGDPSCDADGVANGVCQFDVRVCAGVAVEGCDPVQIDRIEVGGEPLAPPSVPAQAGQCGVPSTLNVTVGGPASATTLRGYRAGELAEVDYLNLCCVTDAGPLAGATCSVVFDPEASSCALPDKAVHKVQRAAELVGQASEQPAAAAKFLRKAGKQMRRLRSLGQKIAKRDDCGFALALMASHAADVIAVTTEPPAP
jgi:hypothetical protein